MPETVELNRAIRYRIYPNDEQAATMAQTFGCSRKVYNMGLELQNGLFKAGMQRMSKTDLNNFCNQQWKNDFPWLREVDKFALTNSLYNLDRAQINFFEGRASAPKFKSRKDKQSYTTNFTNGNIKVIPPSKGKTPIGGIQLPKLGVVRANIHRLPQEGWILKSATVTRTPSGKYFASLLYSFLKEIPDVNPESETVLGLDYSSPHFAVNSFGEPYDPPKWFRKSEGRLAREQKKLSRMTPGSYNYQKQRLVVARIHEHIANQRKDYAHQLSREIANSCTTVCVEDLDLNAMKQSLNFGKATSDAGFGMFRTFLEYKLKEQGRYFVKVDKWFPSSKTCNYCGGYYKDLQLGQETWECPHCHRIIKRDPNAALNIRDEGFRMILRTLIPKKAEREARLIANTPVSDSPYQQNREEHRG